MNQEEAKPIKRGWFPVVGSQKWHYDNGANEGRALCRRAFHFGIELSDNNHKSVDNCAKCKKLLEKEKPELFK